MYVTIGGHYASPIFILSERNQLTGFWLAEFSFIIAWIQYILYADWLLTREYYKQIYSFKLKNMDFIWL